MSAAAVKLVHKLLQFWHWRDTAERRLREEMRTHMERLSKEIAKLEATNESQQQTMNRLEATNKAQQREIDELKRSLTHETAAKAEALRRVGELEKHLAELETKVGKPEVKS